MNNLGILDFPDMIQKSFRNVEFFSIEDAENKIFDNFEKGFIGEDEFNACLDVLEKAIRPHKYTRREKGKGGKWIYYYRDVEKKGPKAEWKEIESDTNRKIEGHKNKIRGSVEDQIKNLGDGWELEKDVNNGDVFGAFKNFGDEGNISQTTITIDEDGGVELGILHNNNAVAYMADVDRFWSDMEKLNEKKFKSVSDAEKAASAFVDKWNMYTYQQKNLKKGLADYYQKVDDLKLLTEEGWEMNRNNRAVERFFNQSPIYSAVITVQHSGKNPGMRNINYYNLNIRKSPDLRQIEYGNDEKINRFIKERDAIFDQKFSDIKEAAKVANDFAKKWLQETT